MLCAYVCIYFHISTIIWWIPIFINSVCKIRILPQCYLGRASTQSDRQVWSVCRQCSRQLSDQYSDGSVDCMDCRRRHQRRSDNPLNSSTRTCCPRVDAGIPCRTTGRDRCMYDTLHDTSGIPNNTRSVSTRHLNQKHKARFPLPELTARVDGWPVSITRQNGRCWRARVFTSRVHGSSVVQYINT